MLPHNLSHFIKIFSKLPGIGYKTSERLGFYILSQTEEYSNQLAESIVNLKRKIKVCSICGNISETDPCLVCTEHSRDRHILCIVEKPIDIYYMESTNSYKGLYHVLGGVISPLNGITPKDLRITELITRMKDLPVDEILFATSPTTEGDTTALFIKELLKDIHIKFTHLARGIPVGTGLQYAGSNSLSQAIKGREEIK
jgi:recombination protein RecR